MPSSTTGSPPCDSIHSRRWSRYCRGREAAEDETSVDHERVTFQPHQVLQVVVGFERVPVVVIAHLRHVVRPEPVTQEERPERRGEFADARQRPEEPASVRVQVRGARSIRRIAEGPLLKPPVVVSTYGENAILLEDLATDLRRAKTVDHVSSPKDRLNTGGREILERGTQMSVFRVHVADDTHSSRESFDGRHRHANHTPCPTTRDARPGLPRRGAGQRCSCRRCAGAAPRCDRFSCP